MKGMADTPSIQELIKKAVEIYDSLKQELEQTSKGKFIAIEVESGEHFISDTREEANAASNEKYPGRVTFTRKIGEDEKVARHSYRGQSWRYAGAF